MMLKPKTKFKQTEIGMVPVDWEVKKVGDFVDIKHGYPFKGGFFTDVPNENVLLTPGNFNIGGGFKKEKFKYTTETYPNEYVLRQGDVIVTMTDLSKNGDTLGYAAKIPHESTKNFLHNQRLGLLKFKSRISEDFLHWVLRTKRYNISVVGSATGSTVKHTSPDRIKQYSFVMPSTHLEQVKIAKILSDLDSKIELNQELNKTLEAIGKTIFRHWFVDFEFPSEEGKPYKSSGGEMVGSALGSIPKNWKLGCLGDIAGNPRRGTQPEAVRRDTPYIGLEHMPRRSISLSDWDTVEEVVSNKFHFSSGEILFGKLRPYFHKVGVAPVNGVCSTDILVIVPKSSEWHSFVLGHVSSDEFVNYTDAGSSGTRMPRSNWKDMARYDIVIPTNSVAYEFNDNIAPLIRKIMANVIQSRTLTEIRDLLLPRLVSGKIRVPVETR